MEEKKNEIRDSIWTFPGTGNLRKFFSLPSSDSTNHGFTLIELLVVIGVIGILAAAVLAAIDPIHQINKGKDGQRKSDLKQIQTALELYRSDQGAYPNALGTSLIVGQTTYMQKVPQDPDKIPYTYIPANSNSTYQISACADNGIDTDPDMKADGSCSSGYRIIFYSP